GRSCGMRAFPEGPPGLRRNLQSRRFHASGPPLTLTDLRRGNQAHGGEISLVTAHVASQNRASQHRRVSADEEVGEYIALGSTLTAILHEGLAREKSSRTWNILHENSHIFQSLVKNGRGCETGGNLRVDDGVDRQIPKQGELAHLATRPFAP